jgi:hypothetical protein
MTPEQIAARLPQLADGPHDDTTITAMAQIIAEAARVLNHATRDAYAISDPATIYTVLGQLSAAAHRLSQLAEQVTCAVRVQGQDGRLAHTGDLDAALVTLQDELGSNAMLHAVLLGRDFGRAHETASGLYRPPRGGEGR